MVSFEEDDLVDCMRHNITLLDDIGIASRIILAPRRKAPPGGLPLEFARRPGEKFSNEEHYETVLSLSQLIRLDDNIISSPSSSTHVPPPAVGDQIRARLLTRLGEMEEGGGKSTIRAVQCAAQRPSGELRIHFEPFDPLQRLMDEKRQGISMTSRLLAETKLEDDAQTYAEYAKFEAMEGAPNSKKFSIVFPFACNGRGIAIPIFILRSATINDLIGLACHVYTREQNQPECELPAHYDLYLAEEDSLEYDAELPPQDRRRRVAECGFPTLAMVRRANVGRRPSQGVVQCQINIYMVDGRCYTMEVESTDIPLRQAFDYAMERKRADDELLGAQNTVHFREVPYVLEPLEQPGVVLNLSGSVSSCGTTEFVLIRVNSSRGENLIPNVLVRSRPLGLLGHSRSMDFSKESGPAQQTAAALYSAAGGSKPVTPTVVLPEFEWSKKRNRFSAQPLSPDDHQYGDEVGKLLLLNGDLGGGVLLEEYEVNRIHRFQPKTASKLVVRERCLELLPVLQVNSQEQKRKTSGTTGKRMKDVKRIPWELVAAVEVPPHSEQRPNARRSVRIIWLCGSSQALTRSLVSPNGRSEESAAYEGSFWKTLLIEAAGHEAWNIGVRLSELLDSRPSPVHLLYQHSAGATLKPQSSAEKAFGPSSKSLQRSPEGGGLSSKESSWIGEKRHSKKLSQMFQRMLSTKD